MVTIKGMVREHSGSYGRLRGTSIANGVIAKHSIHSDRPLIYLLCTQAQHSHLLFFYHHHLFSCFDFFLLSRSSLSRHSPEWTAITNQTATACSATFSTLTSARSSTASSAHCSHNTTQPCSLQSQHPQHRPKRRSPPMCRLSSQLHPCSSSPHKQNQGFPAPM